MSSSFSPTFYIGQIRIGSVEGSSCINFGNNTNAGFSSEKKHNQGFGNISGDRNEMLDTRTLLDDADFLDMFNGSMDEDIPEWLGQILQEVMEKEKEDAEITPAPDEESP